MERLHVHAIHPVHHHDLIHECVIAILLMRAPTYVYGLPSQMQAMCMQYS